MKLYQNSGKKFRDSAYCIMAFEQLKKDEQRLSIFFHLCYFLVLLAVEFSLCSILCR